MRTHDGPHAPDGDPACDGCRYKSVTFNPFATPSRANSKPPKLVGNSWEKGVPRDARNMPFLDANLQPMSAKEFAEKGTEFTRQLRAETAAASS